MLRTVEAVIDNQNHVQWSEHIQLNSPQRVLITLLDPAPLADETLLVRIVYAHNLGVNPHACTLRSKRP